MIKALIFDFDGLIVDTETPDYQAWSEIYVDHGATLPLKMWSTHIGSMGRFNPYSYLEEQIGREVDRIKINEQRKERYRHLCEKQPILPGVLEMINSARSSGIKLAVATNSFGRWVNGHLERLQLKSLFDVVISLDQITIGKPEPKMYLITLSQLGVQPSEAVAFEDSPAGAMSARRAGIYTIVVPNRMTKHLDFVHYDRMVTSMTDLTLDDIIKIGEESPASN